MLPVFMWQTPWYFKKADYPLGSMLTFPLYRLKMEKEFGKDRTSEVQATALNYPNKQNSLTDGKKTQTIQFLDSSALF